MAYIVVLESEQREELASVVEPPQSDLNTALPAAEDGSWRLANTIDPYGDTTFNGLQCRVLAKEWRLLIERTPDEPTGQFLRHIDELLARCASGVHLYVRFIGD